MPLPVLTLYSRPGCHLCEQAEEHLRALGLSYAVRDISGDAALTARYGWHIPVLALGERELLRGVLSRSRLAQLKLRLLAEGESPAPIP
ncbi:Glutaredoxin-like domain [Deinococcus reticulitermitis]|uniref:Glutaredoxin-like domain n=1 Tax=Deinococcus reticulitermitis TaxID=856736 RepID=A0A1H7BNZ9_9DEIO|nr:glutaredoxin family protein [Deinococcus reticulitermitis]SEJ75135.1 Glutaredoxin-like domain [Deinococcus reticulitermitis]